MSKVLVDRELLERAVSIPTKESLEASSAAIIDRGRAQAEIRELLAQPAEAEGVEALTTWRADMEWPDDEMVVRQSDHIAALSAVTAERDRVRSLIEECGEYLDTDRETTIGSGSILHRQMIAALAAKES